MSVHDGGFPNAKGEVDPSYRGLPGSLPATRPSGPGRELARAEVPHVLALVGSRGSARYRLGVSAWLGLAGRGRPRPVKNLGSRAWKSERSTTRSRETDSGGGGLSDFT